MTFPYRANALERDLNLPQGIPNLQVRQVGYALDYEHLDIYGRPKMTYAWNRNVHAKDLATRKPSGNLTPPYTPPAVSKEPLRVLPKPNRTKAYRDAEEFLKAEEDFREKQRFRNQITPARRNGLLTVGTNLSTSGLPVPDKNGNVYSYPAEVTAMTGLVYESPVANEIPQIDHRNVPSQKRQPVILTEEPRLKVDADTGETKLSFGTGTVIPPSILVAESHPLPMPKIFPGIVKSEEDPVLPGSFPNPQRDAKQTTPTMPLPELTDKTEIQNILEAEQAALIEATQPL
ncbi:hypothetical protein DFS34DRAFT_639740 [Phlyctochytrium arcticum]|nr:hypothetical protein DFS34DRAFT_639740 [Phlyctochytrium arcticum]